MPKIFVCAGCGKEIDANFEKWYPQKNEVYCQSCNKRFHEWVAWKTEKYAEYDKAKAQEFAAKKKEIFSQKPSPKIDLGPAPAGKDIDNSAFLNGNTDGQSPDEFDPTLREAVEKAKKAKR